MLDTIKVNVVKNSLRAFFEEIIDEKDLKVSVYEEHWSLRLHIENKGKLIVAITMVFHWPIVFLSDFKIELPWNTVKTIDFLYNLIEKSANIFGHSVMIGTVLPHSSVKATLMENDWVWITGVKVPDGPENINVYYKNLKEKKPKGLSDD